MFLKFLQIRQTLYESQLSCFLLLVNDSLCNFLFFCEQFVHLHKIQLFWKTIIVWRKKSTSLCDLHWKEYLLITVRFTEILKVKLSNCGYYHANIYQPLTKTWHIWNHYKLNLYETANIWPSFDAGISNSSDMNK